MIPFVYKSKVSRDSPSGPVLPMHSAWVQFLSSELHPTTAPTKDPKCNREDQRSHVLQLKPNAAPQKKNEQTNTIQTQIHAYKYVHTYVQSIFLSIYMYTHIMHIYKQIHRLLCA